MKSVSNDQTCPPARMCRDVSPPDGGEQEADVEHIVTQHDAHIKSIKGKALAEYVAQCRRVPRLIPKATDQNKGCWMYPALSRHLNQ